MAEGLIMPMAKDEGTTAGNDRRASFALPGLVLASGALICAIISLLVLLGLTPIKPETNIVIASATVNAVFVIGLIYLITREIMRLMRARSKGRAAARLHVRIVALFSIVAITPRFWWRSSPRSRSMSGWTAGSRCVPNRSCAPRSMSPRPMCWRMPAICRARPPPWPMIWNATASSIASTAPASPS